MNVPEKLGGEMQKMKFMLALSLYEKREISLNEAAEMTNVDSKQFINMLGDYNDGIIFG